VKSVERAMRRFIIYSVVGLLVLVLVPLLAIAFFVIGEKLSYNRVEITSVLLREGKYDPSEHFRFDKACVFPPESALAGGLRSKGYREIDQIFPESHINWTLVLIDEKEKTFRTLYVLNPEVRFGGQILCGTRLVLVTKIVDGVTVAQVEFKNPPTGEQ
jgi:hypothetical protein